MTYPYRRVEEAMTRFVPVKISFKDQPEVAAGLGAVWTPTFQFRTPDDRLVRASVGFFEPEAFLVELALGVCHYCATGRVEALMETWADLLDRYPLTTWAMKVSFIRAPVREGERRAG